MRTCHIISVYFPHALTKTFRSLDTDTANDPWISEAVILLVLTSQCLNLELIYIDAYHLFKWIDSKYLKWLSNFHTENFQKNSGNNKKLKEEKFQGETPDSLNSMNIDSIGSSLWTFLKL